MISLNNFMLKFYQTASDWEEEEKEGVLILDKFN